MSSQGLKADEIIKVLKDILLNKGAILHEKKTKKTD